MSNTREARFEVEEADPALRRWLDGATRVLEQEAEPHNRFPHGGVTAAAVYAVIRQIKEDPEIRAGSALPPPDDTVVDAPQDAPASYRPGQSEHRAGTTLAHRVWHACGGRH
jgi:hypothetical protein